MSDETADWPQSLIRPVGDVEEDTAADDADDAGATLLSFPERRRVNTSDTKEVTDIAVDSDAPVAVIDEVKADDIIRASRPPAAPTREDAMLRAEALEDDAPGHGLWIPIILGFALLGASVAALLVGAEALLGDWGAVLALVGAIAGALMVVFALYLIAAGDDETD